MRTPPVVRLVLSSMYWIMNADGNDPRPVADTYWEEAMPLPIPDL